MNSSMVLDVSHQGNVSEFYNVKVVNMEKEIGTQEKTIFPSMGLLKEGRIGH